MQTISAILYFLSHYPLWSFLILFVFFLLLCAIRGKTVFLILSFVVPMANIFLSHMLNAWFLNAYGTRATAVITHAEQTNSTHNDQYIWDYDVVLKTPEGKDIVTGFSTMSAAIYPIRNSILIPKMSEPFVVKYIPGYEKNIVIMSDESIYGKRRIIYENQQPVEKARRQLEASPNNEEFKKEYLQELKKFVADSDNAMDSISIKSYQAIIDVLE